MSARVGLGFDVHRLVPGRRCVLGGVELPHPSGPLGHSDGDAVLHALRREGKLRSLGLVQLTRIDGTDSGPLTLKGAVYSVLLRPLQDEEDVLASFLEPTAPPSLTGDDYPHLAADIGILQRVLRSALARREPGVNILLYGPPGTGKTELARKLDDALDICGKYEAKLTITGRDTGATGHDFAAYVLETMRDPQLSAKLAAYRG